MPATLTRQARAELETYLRANPWARAVLHDAIAYCCTAYAGVERTYAPEEVTVIAFMGPTEPCGAERCDCALACVTIQRGGRYRSSFGLDPSGPRLWAD